MSILIPQKKKYYNRNIKDANANENKNKNKNENENENENDSILIFKYKKVINNENNYYEEISIYDFIKNINIIASSTNIVNISKNIDLYDPLLISYAASEANKFKTALRGDNTLFIYKYMIDKIKCDINPCINSKLKKSIAIVKWKLYNFMIKKKESNKNEYDTEVINWLALLVGIYLYFDEKDELNFKQSTLLYEVCKPFTIHSFK